MLKVTADADTGREAEGQPLPSFPSYLQSKSLDKKPKTHLETKKPLPAVASKRGDNMTRFGGW